MKGFVSWSSLARGKYSCSGKVGNVGRVMKTWNVLIKNIHKLKEIKFDLVHMFFVVNHRLMQGR